MVDAGWLTEDEATFWQAAPTAPSFHEVLPAPNDYFPSEVEQQLLNDPQFAMLGATEAERHEAVFQGGLRVYTTFDPAAQQQALAARDSRAARSRTASSRSRGSTRTTGEPNRATAAVVVGRARHRRGAHDGRRARLRQLPVQPRHPEPPGRRLVVQDVRAGHDHGAGLLARRHHQRHRALHLRRTARAGRALRGQQLRRRRRHRWAPITAATLASSNCAFVRLGLHRRHARTWPRWPTASASRDARRRRRRRRTRATICAGARRRRSAPPASPRSRWRRPTPPSPTTASTTRPTSSTASRTATATSSTSTRRRPSSASPPRRARLVTERAPAERAERHRHPGRRSAASPPPARPAPTRTPPTPGSSATRRRCRPRCGWAALGHEYQIRIAGGPGITGGQYPARIWGAFMNAWQQGRPRGRLPGAARRAPAARRCTVPGRHRPDAGSTATAPAAPPPDPNQPPIIPGLPGFPPQPQTPADRGRRPAAGRRGDDGDGDGRGGDRRTAAVATAAPDDVPADRRTCPRRG